MAIQFRRGLDEDRTFVPVVGEPCFDIDDKELYVGDGSTIGGIFIGPGSKNLGEEFKAAMSSGYLEFSYSGVELDTVTIWNNVFKTIKYYTKDISYTSSKVTSVVITNEQTLNTLTKTISYSGENIISITNIEA